MRLPEASSCHPPLKLPPAAKAAQTIAHRGMAVWGVGTGVRGRTAIRSGQNDAGDIVHRAGDREGRPHRRSAAQQWREIGDRLDSRVNLESQLLRNLGGASLNPKCPQSGRCGGDTIPVIRRDEATLGVAYLHALGSEVVDARADLEYLHLLDADDFVEQITD